MDIKAFYDEQIEMLAEKNAAKLVEAHYHDEAVMLVASGEEPIVAKGKQAITELFNGYLTYVYKGFLSTEKFIPTEDSLMFEATIDTANGPARVYDSMYMKDGKIIRHFSGMLQ